MNDLAHLQVPRPAITPKLYVVLTFFFKLVTTQHYRLWSFAHLAPIQQTLISLREMYELVVI